MACLQGVQAAIGVGAGNVILESDSLIVVQAINTGAYSESAVGTLVDELRSLVVDNFISFQCVFKVRECNRAAHQLAELGSLCAEGDELFSSLIPECVAVIVANDLLAPE